ncbi:permease [Caldalkalibacillus thermarum]|uniref:DMT family transporter n=1 Tax=Caldalkalibacillus thermarum TaxID=296745 RepID=UPI00166F29C5|nr:DMT family transporter [Caldalkalibacillus thermarum]GGK22234.1 permease [Caldalkalibacillus thermarum]
MNWKMILLCTIWGTNWVVMSTALYYFSPLMFSALRFMLGSAVLLLFCLIRKIPLPKKEDWKWYALCGVLQISCVFAITQSALQFVEIGIASILAFTMPFWLTMMAHFFIPGEQMTRFHLLGLGIGFGGLFLVLDVNPWALEWTGTVFVVQTLCLIAAVSWATASLIIKKVLNGRNQIQLTAYQMVVGTIVLFLFTFTIESEPMASWNGMAVFCLIFAGVIASALAYFLWSHILSSGGAGQSSISLLLVPVIGTLSGWVFLGETLAVDTLVGIGLVLAGIWIVNRKQTGAEKKGPPAPVNHQQKGAL